jgi:hypothetical protein
VDASKKHWQKPAVEKVELARARELIEEAIRLIEKDSSEAAELRSILEILNARMAKD